MIDSERNQNILARHGLGHQPERLRIDLVALQIHDRQGGHVPALALYHLDHGVDIKRLVQHAIHACPQCLRDQPLQLAMAGHDHSHGFGIDGPYLAQRLDAVHAGHHDVDEHQVIGCLSHALNGGLAAFGCGHNEVFVFEDVAESLPHAGIIIHDENAQPSFGGGRQLLYHVLMLFLRPRLSHESPLP